MHTAVKLIGDHYEHCSVSITQDHWLIKQINIHCSGRFPIILVKGTRLRNLTKSNQCEMLSLPDNMKITVATMPAYFMYNKLAIIGHRLQDFHVIKPVSVTCSKSILMAMSMKQENHIIQSFVLAQLYLWQSSECRAKIIVNLHLETNLTCSVLMEMRSFHYTFCSRYWFEDVHMCHEYWDSSNIPSSLVCIAGRCYNLFPTDKLTWWQAHRKCQSIGWNLISVTSFEEQRIVTWILHRSFDVLHHERIYLGTIIHKTNVMY